MKKLFAAALMIAAGSSAMAQNNVGCGWGSAVFNGQRGVAPQVLAATTNGTSGNQTFGITFGTVGCTQDGVVRSNWKVSAYIEGNSSKLARDMSAGQGESLEARQVDDQPPISRRMSFDADSEPTRSLRASSDNGRST